MRAGGADRAECRQRGERARCVGDVAADDQPVGREQDARQEAGAVVPRELTRPIPSELPAIKLPAEDWRQDKLLTGRSMVASLVASYPKPHSNPRRHSRE